MKNYFMLQYKMLNRKLQEFGVHPVIGYILICVAFCTGSVVVYNRILYPHYAYPFLAVLTLLKLSEPKRNYFLKTCFASIDYSKIRLIENTLLALPFIAFMLYKGDYIYSSGILIISLIISQFSNNYTWSQVIPTPFGKRPFEFTRGYRVTLLLILLCYFLCYMGIHVDNFNLSLFSLGLLFCICISYYFETEGEYFVWIHEMTPRAFIIHKAKTALLYTSILSLPIVIVLIIFFSVFYAPILIITAIGFLNIISIVLARYSRYPKDIALPQAIIFVVCGLFSPLLIFSLPYFYKRSLNQLHKTLG